MELPLIAIKSEFIISSRRRLLIRVGVNRLVFLMINPSKRKNQGKKKNPRYRRSPLILKSQISIAQSNSTVQRLSGQIKASLIENKIVKMPDIIKNCRAKLQAYQQILNLILCLSQCRHCHEYPPGKNKHMSILQQQN